MKKLLLAMILFPALAGAQLPEKPVPVVDREFKADLGALGAGWTLDAVSTHHVLSDPRGYENGVFFHGSRSTAKVMGAWALTDTGSAFAGYLWKKHVRNRYLHPFWRAWLLVPAFGHIEAAVGNWTLPDERGVTWPGTGHSGLLKSLRRHPSDNPGGFHD